MRKACVIGMGGIGNTHCRVYTESQYAGLAAVCDIRADRAEAGGRKFSVPFYTDAETMLREIKPDIVSVATGGAEYASDHYLPTMQALKAGCHVLCEKPISDRLDHGTEMVETARAMGVCFGVNLNHRFTPAARIAKKWQENGCLGELLFLNMALWIGKPGSFESPHYHLKALNPHSIDILRYYGGGIEEVMLYAMQAKGRDIWSTASWNFKFTNGAVGHLTSSYDLARGHPMERIEVAGTDGRFIVDDMWREATLYPARNLVKQVYTNPVFGGFREFYDTFKDRIDAFAQQVSEGAKPEDIDGSGADGLEATRVIHAGIQSLKMGLPVKVSEIKE
jgi:predicted dehydrogenase